VLDHSAHPRWRQYPGYVAKEGAERGEDLEIPSGRAHLSVVRQGSGGTPTVVFLHAGISDKRSWQEVLDHLSSDMDVVAYDRRGFGTTTYRAEAHDQLVDLLVVLDFLTLDQVVLVGNSRGGRIALDFTLTHPERVGALVLVAPGVSGAPPVDDSEIDQVERAIWDTLAAADSAGALEALNLGEIRLWVDGPHAPEGRVDGPRRELALDMNRIALGSESPGHEPAPSVGAWSRLSEVHCPVLVVVGDLDLGHMKERAHGLARTIPGAGLVVMEGVAHLPGFEQPSAFASHLRDSLHGTG
jgi:pimeloyl-ACP methyl ester carboxylesterase